MYRGISDSKKSYQLKTNTVKVKYGDLVADSHSILARLRNHSSQPLNVQGDNDVGQTKIHSVEQPVPEPSAVGVELAIEKLKSHKSPGINKIPAKLLKVGDKKFAMRSINVLFLFGIRRNSLRRGRSR